MGFCFFGNVVIGARHALEAHGLERVAIVDFDVHHGNGTQDLVWEDKRVLLRLDPPDAALSRDRARGTRPGAFGQIVNVPLPPGASGGVFRAGMLSRVLPAVEAHGPEMILISAGFDAHARDPLANLAAHRGGLRLGDGAALRAGQPLLRGQDRLDSRGRI